MTDGNSYKTAISAAFNWEPCLCSWADKDALQFPTDFSDLPPLEKPKKDRFDRTQLTFAMCGRKAQTRYAVRAAADVLDAQLPSGSDGEGSNESRRGSSASAPSFATGESASTTNPSSSVNFQKWEDNFNICPGMEAMVFWRDGEGGIQSSLKKWGLVVRSGSRDNPLPIGMNQHFENLMYNARSETLWDKITFRSLLNRQRTCLVAVDGFFEWKSELKGKKQPYFVHRNNSHRPFLLLPGLWTSVPTGRNDEPTLDTFTILTTEACDCLKWLHTRMPVCLWDEDLGKQWLHQPSVEVLRRMEASAAASREKLDLEWHPVTMDMTSLKFRSEKAVAPLKRASVKSFFAVKPAETAQTPPPKLPNTKAGPNENKQKGPNAKELCLAESAIPKGAKPHVSNPPNNKNPVVAFFQTSATKRPAPSTTAAATVARKKAKVIKKGSIASFFVPKS